MPSPESNRRNLEDARASGRVIFWRTRGESQRIKGEIVWLHDTKPELSQRAIARTFHVSQPYVAKLLRGVRLLGVSEALGAESYETYRSLRQTERREHFQNLPAWAKGAVGVQSPAPTSVAPAATTAGLEYVELARSTTGEVFELYGSTPPSARPCDAPPPQRAGMIPIRCIWTAGREETDAILREFAGITGRNRKNSWF
jgi:hypothetical protein